MVTFNQIQKRINKNVKNNDVKFEKVPRDQVTPEMAREVIERMRRGLVGLDPFIKNEKKSWWRKSSNKLSQLKSFLKNKLSANNL